MINSISDLRSPIGLVAGNGNFPLEFARSAKSKNLQVVAVAHQGETSGELEALVSGCAWLKVGQLGKIIEFFKSKGVKQVAFAGGIKKARLFREISLDFRAMLLLAQLKYRGDDELLRAVVNEIEKSGMAVFSASLVLDKALAPKGLIAGRALSADERRNAKLGWEAAKALGSLDIGQTVCVSRGVITALEAVEGTDATIRRAFELVGSAGVIVKTCKPNQDLRLDLPAIGVETISSLVAAKATALIVEAGKTLMVDPEQIRQNAQRANIALVGIESDSDLEKEIL